jgi:integrase/recombinase XerD
MNNSPPPAPSQLNTIMARCEGAYSSITLRGYRSDLEQFIAWCDDLRVPWLPAHPKAVAAFVDHELREKAIATIRRRISAIQFAHQMADLMSPIGHSEVRLALRRAARSKNRRPKQALGLTADLLDRLVAGCPQNLAGMRDAALLSVGYDTLCRSSELTAVTVEDLAEEGQSIEVRRSKADHHGDGRLAYLSPATQLLLRAWMEASEIKTGALFRSLHTCKVSAQPLDTSSVRRLIKRAAARAKVGPDIAAALSGHSMRVGAAQDMMVAGCDTLGIMQAGGWRTHAVLARYVENAAARRIHVRRWRRICASQS